MCCKIFLCFRNFSVENSQSNYRLNVQGYMGNAGKIRFKRFNNFLLEVGFVKIIHTHIFLKLKIALNYSLLV